MGFTVRWDLPNWRGGVRCHPGERGQEQGSGGPCLALLCSPGALLPRGMPGVLLLPPEQIQKPVTGL